MHSTAYAVVQCTSVRLSVCHIRVLYRNESTYSQTFFAIWYTHHATLVFPHQHNGNIPTWSPNESIQCKWDMNKNLAITNTMIDHTRLTISGVNWRWILSWPWNVGYRSLKIIEGGTIWKLGYGLLFSFHSNYSRIFSHFGDIQRQRMAWPWNLGMGSFKVIENDVVR